MLRVLIAGFCAVPSPDRAGVQVGHAIRALARRSAVDVLAARRGEQPYVERSSRVRMLRVPIPDAPLAERAEAFQRALRRQLDGGDYDVVHVRDGWSASVVAELQRRFGYAVVFDAARATLADPSSVDEGALPGLLEAETRCVRAADIVLAPSEPARRHLASLTSPDRVWMAPPGVDVNHFDWDDPADRGPPRILYLGPVGPGRGVRLIIQAMMEVSRHADARLVLAGPADAPYLERVTASARACGIADRLELPGEIPHEDAPDLIARATVCVAPRAADLSTSPAALFPTKLLEFMACRRPVVAARRSAATLLVREGETGLLFTPGDPADLADRIKALLADPDLRERLAAAGYEHVRKHYSASGTRRALRRAYDGLAAYPEWAEVFERAASRAAAAPAGARAAGAIPVVANPGVARLQADDLADPGEPLADDITAVEPPSFVGVGGEAVGAVGVGADTGEAALAAGDDTGEDWVVEDSLTRDHRPGDIAAIGAGRGAGDEPQPPPVDNRFAAGELDITGALEGQGETPFSAVSPPLGADDETENRPPPRHARGPGGRGRSG